MTLHNRHAYKVSMDTEISNDKKMEKKKKKQILQTPKLR